MDILITGGRIIDPGCYEGPGDVLVVDGKDCRRPQRRLGGCSAGGVLTALSGY